LVTGGEQHLSQMQKVCSILEETSYQFDEGNRLHDCAKELWEQAEEMELVGELEAVIPFYTAAELDLLL
jgi:hypothetical protein